MAARWKTTSGRQPAAGKKREKRGERERVERDEARERTFETRSRCGVDAEAHRRQHCTGGHGTAGRQHRAGRQPILPSRGTGRLPAGVRANRHSGVSHGSEHARRIFTTRV